LTVRFIVAVKKGKKKVDYEIKQTNKGTSIRLGDSHVSATAEGGIIITLPPRVEPVQVPVGSDPLLGRSIAEIQRHYYLATMELVGGNVRKAAKILGVTPLTVYKWRKKHEGKHKANGARK
jgi:DNA-binding NtrC family response regulator